MLLNCKPICKICHKQAIATAILAAKMNPIVELREVVKVYSTEAGEFPALRGVSLSVNAGEFLGIVGKSGAGKSTLLNMINGVDHLTSGDVFVRSSADEVAVHRLTEV